MDDIKKDITLSELEKIILLKIARKAVSSAAINQKPEPISLELLPPQLQELGASFVTLTKDGRLRGCIGTIEAFQPLALDIQEHAIGAAICDPRFPKVSKSELDDITIEISYLTPKIEIIYNDHTDLVSNIVPGLDGVVFVNGFRRATFLPQVWDKLPDPCEFLSHLSAKLGNPPDDWINMRFEVYRYQVLKFSEEEYQDQLSG